VAEEFFPTDGGVAGKMIPTEGMEKERKKQMKRITK